MKGDLDLSCPSSAQWDNMRGMKAEQEGRRQTGTATQPCSMNQESSSASKAKVVMFIAALLGTDMAHRVPVLYVNVLLAMPKVPGTQRVLHRHLWRSAHPGSGFTLFSVFCSGLLVTLRLLQSWNHFFFFFI